jgi:hypothetical protein
MIHNSHKNSQQSQWGSYKYETILPLQVFFEKIWNHDTTKTSNPFNFYQLNLTKWSLYSTMMMSMLAMLTQMSGWTTYGPNTPTFCVAKKSGAANQTPWKLHSIISLPSPTSRKQWTNFAHWQQGTYAHCQKDTLVGAVAHITNIFSKAKPYNVRSTEYFVRLATTTLFSKIDIVACSQSAYQTLKKNP